MIDPEQVTSPRNKVNGPIMVLCNTGDGGYSIVNANYGGEVSTLIRWNGTAGDDKGYPTDRGQPTWFRLPDEIAKLVESALAIRCEATD
jgi:hypothetical protein